MEIGGLMAQAFKAFLGNPTIMSIIITWAIIIALLFTVVESFKDTEL